MGKQKKIRKFAEMKRVLNPKDLKPCVTILHQVPSITSSASAGCQCSQG